MDKGLEKLSLQNTETEIKFKNNSMNNIKNNNNSNDHNCFNSSNGKTRKW